MESANRRLREANRRFRILNRRFKLANWRAKSQILANHYAEPFKGDILKVIALAIELDDNGKRLLDFAQVLVCVSSIFG